MREKYPQHFAMTYTGFATGLRPSSMRPLRRSGPTPDVLWDQNVLLIRQSQMEGNEVMQCTKTGSVQRIAVPEQLIDLLRWHVDTQLRLGLQKNSLLLFPSEDGGFRARSALDKPFREVAKAITLTRTGIRSKHRAIRRSLVSPRVAPAPQECPVGATRNASRAHRSFKRQMHLIESKRTSRARTTSARACSGHPWGTAPARGQERTISCDTGRRKLVNRQLLLFVSVGVTGIEPVTSTV